MLQTRMHLYIIERDELIYKDLEQRSMTINCYFLFFKENKK